MTFDPATDPNNVTATALPGGTFADLEALRADPSEGDGAYPTGTGLVFEAWQYVWLTDRSQAFYDLDADRWVPGSHPPSMPYTGSVIADLPTLKKMLSVPGAPVSTLDDPNLERALLAAQEWCYERTMHCDWDHPDVQTAILLLAARLYQRRKTPEGVAGFAGDGVVVRVIASDPDITRLLERHLEMLTAGIG